MGNPKSFLTISRHPAGYRPVGERVKDYAGVELALNTQERMLQASRCMDCGVPFCHWACPLGNRQPEWQDAVYKGEWRQAYEILSSTNDFPEVTGRLCPALCEKSCVLALDHQAVTIRENEAAVAERAFEEMYIKPVTPLQRHSQKVAVIGSGPAGLTVANRLNRRGFHVVVYEKDEAPGGLLRLGIPDFKLDKRIVGRRIDLMQREGVEFITGTEVGVDICASALLDEFDALCLCIGSGVPRDLKVGGRGLEGIHFALDFLRQQNRMNAGADIPDDERISAHGKNVLVIGGGDTGSDCVGTAVRQGALSVTQIEIMPKPPEGDNPLTPWPAWPAVLRTSSSHEEGCTRRWSLATNRFTGEKGRVTGAEVEAVEWSGEPGAPPTGTGRTETIRADLVLLAMGFVHPSHEGPVQDLGLALDSRGNILCATDGGTSEAYVYTAGDSASGASLIVRAIASGQKAAAAIEKRVLNEG